MDADNLDWLYDLCARNERAATSRIVDHLDDWLNQGQITTADAIFADADPQRLADSVIVSMLGITRAAAAMMPNRMEFYERSRRAIAESRGSIEAADKLLAKYRGNPTTPDGPEAR